MNPSPPTSAPSRRARLLIALGIGAAAVGIAAIQAVALHGAPTDFGWIWFAARASLHGRDAYQLIGPGREWDYVLPFLYPLTAPTVILPLALLPLLAARLCFVGVSSALLAYGITRDGYARLPVFLSGAWLIAVIAAQWSPLLVAAALIPELTWVYAAKPNFGAALLLSTGTRRSWRVAVIGGVLVLLVSLVLNPHWFASWLGIVRQDEGRKMPLLTPAGVLLLLALLRWRRRDAHLILLLAVTPMTIVAYDALPLFLIPSTLVEATLLSIGSVLAARLHVFVHSWPQETGWPVATAGHLVLTFWPALVMILRRPNEGDVPPWLERLSARFPAWLRGRAASLPAAP